jgi:hypothetical protein
VLAAVGLLILFQLAFAYLGAFQALFGSTPIDGATWVRILLVASTVLFLVELEKLVTRRRSPDLPSQGTD